MSEDKLYYSIKEVTVLTGVPAHVLRYWEQEFKSLNPKRSKSGVRQYRRRDLDLIYEIHSLLYDRKFTIKGAIEELKRPRTAASEADSASPIDSGDSVENAESASTTKPSRKSRKGDAVESDEKKKREFPQLNLFTEIHAIDLAALEAELAYNRAKIHHTNDLLQYLRNELKSILEQISDDKSEA